MRLMKISCILRLKTLIPIRQDVVVTSEINLGVDGIIQVTAVGGLYEKIKAAEAWVSKKW
jgi:predicted ATP-dependent protease